VADGDRNVVDGMVDGVTDGVVDGATDGDRNVMDGVTDGNDMWTVDDGMHINTQGRSEAMRQPSVR